MSNSQEDCAERIRLVDEYSRRVTAYSVRIQALKKPGVTDTDADWLSAEVLLRSAQQAWDAIEQHLAAHRCLELHWPKAPDRVSSPGNILEKAALAAIDIILIADNDRRYVDVNDAGAELLGLPRDEIVGRQIDEFFSEAGGEAIPAAWESFVSEGVQAGICELRGSARRRKFDYRAKANFAPGLHLSVLRELVETR